MATSKGKKKKTVAVESVKHNEEKRKNIPTEELRDFVKEDEKVPKTLLYPRDPSLDPQLVWKGKDEQDREDLEVPAVPIYIQEKIHPQVIVENVKAEAKSNGKYQQADLFDDFNGIEFEDLIEFYQHDQNWSNRMILGDSLMVMASLAEKEGLKGKVQMIYIDPPYGIKFGSNWQVSTRKRDVKDSKAEDATRQPEQIRAFRDTWKLGIHSYLAYLRDRLVVARELLNESGSVFVQIGDENVHLVRNILDEVYGSENFIAQIAIQKTGGLVQDYLPRTYDILLWYGKNEKNTKYYQLYLARSQAPQDYQYVQMSNGVRRSLKTEEKKGLVSIPVNSKLFSTTSLESANPIFCYTHNNKQYKQRWKTNISGLQRLSKSDRISDQGRTLRYVRFFDDFPARELQDVWADTMGEREMVYVVQTNTKIIERCLLMTTDPGDLVLDPTCGSGTTAYVAEQWGRRWITIDTSRVALALARTRLMAAKYPSYILADSPEGIKKEAEITGKVPPPHKTESDIKKGFIYKRVPHITLKSIANNPEIDEIQAKWQEKLEPIREKLNKAVKKSWEEWEIPFEPEEAWPKKAKDLLAEWLEIRRKRQKEIDDSIARAADQELLYNQPYVDNKKIRVSGPLTVESLSPHRVFATDDARPKTETTGQAEDTNGQFETMIIDHLKSSGVQNTIKNERLKFDRLEPFAGMWIQAEGEYTEMGGDVKRTAVCIGPEHGTVGPDLIKEAAKEAVQGVGFDILIVCGFAFDPHVSEEAKRYGKLTVLPTRMNPDLAMGDELLKKTGAGNLFMVFGEPDVDIKKQKDDKITVEIRGLDIYDPTTGQIRASSTDEIACWFIDTNYNGESFFVRQAYFSGANDPYGQLKRALRAEINEAAWSTLYSNKSFPFDTPETGKIAIKVINHYGDEVLKVYEIGGIDQ